MVDFILIAGVITLCLSIIIRSVKMFSTQALLLSIIFFIPSSLVVPLLFFQLILIVYAIYRYKRAVDINYQLILEKTHQIPRKLTAGGNFGDDLR